MSFWKRLFTKPYATVRAHEVMPLLDVGAVLLDVREPHEWRAGHAPKARHIPLDQLPERLSEVPRGRTVVTVCRSGMRSRQAAKLLASQGRQVANLTGGMHAWARAGLPVVVKGGRTGQVA